MKNQKLSLLVAVSACLLALSGCAPSGGGDSSNQNSGDSSNQNSGEATVLEGTWVVNDKGFCGEAEITDDSGTTVSVFSYGNQVMYPTITFKGNSRTVQSEYYSDSECTTKTEVSSSFFNQSGTFQIENGSLSLDGKDLIKVVAKIELSQSGVSFSYDLTQYYYKELNKLFLTDGGGMGSDVTAPTRIIDYLYYEKK